MADRVIIVGTKRAGNRISPVELMQMAGRAGRSEFSSIGYVDMIVELSEIDTIEERLNDSDNFIISSMLNYNRVGFHLMGEIANGRIRNIKQAKNWYERSFDCFCGGDVLIEKVINMLKELECVLVFSNRLKPTKLGEISSKYYFSPEDVFGWKSNFNMIYNMDLLNNDVAMAWALSSVPGQSIEAYLGKKKFLLDEYIDQVSSVGLDCDGEQSMSGLMWWSVLGGPSVGSLSYYKKIVKADFERLGNALIEIDQAEQWGIKNFFESLKMQVYYGIPSYLVSLCRLKGICKSYAYELYNIGIENEQQLRDRYSEIEFLENDGLKSVVRDLINNE